jgi:hypothetical protein
MTATLIQFPGSPPTSRRTILTLGRGPALRVSVVEEVTPGRGTLYFVVRFNLFASGETITGPISGQHTAIAMARAELA